MKTKSIKSRVIFFLSVVLFFTISAFVVETESGKNKSTDLTKNTELKNEVFNQIINNKQLFTEFMNDMMQNSQTMNWMINNNGMMNYMFSGDHLGYMMHHNADMNQMMMQNMMNTIQADSVYMHQWNNMMMNHSNGMHQGSMMNQSGGMHHGGMMMHGN